MCATLDITSALSDTILGFDQRVAQSLMISLRVMMLGELTDGTAKGLLTKEDHPIDALIFS